MLMEHENQNLKEVGRGEEEEGKTGDGRAGHSALAVLKFQKTQFEKHPFTVN